MIPLGAVLVMLFTVNLAVSFTTSERGEVLEQTFGLVKEVMGYDSMLGAIEKSTEIQGVDIAERKKWRCSGSSTGPEAAEVHDEVFLRGEDCDVVEDFIEGMVVSRCKYADGSGEKIGQRLRRR